MSPAVGSTASFRQGSVGEAASPRQYVVEVPPSNGEDVQCSYVVHTTAYYNRFDKNGCLSKPSLQITPPRREIPQAVEDRFQLGL